MSATRFTIHEGQPGDAQAISELGVLVWQHAYRGILPADVLAGLEPRARQNRIIDSFATGSVWHVARDLQHNIVGFTQGRPATKHADWEMNAIYVHPDWQRFGIGRVLQLALVESIERRGGCSLAVYVLAKNYPAKRFYIKHGARLVGADALEVREISYLLDVFLYDSLSRLKRSLQAAG
jgi:ribosomal protein S18 acetylase RimI-like enzyme